MVGMALGFFLVFTLILGIILIYPDWRSRRQSGGDHLTPHARDVLSHAQGEAEQLDHQEIGVEHLLLGLLRERNGIAGCILRETGFESGWVRERIHQQKTDATSLSSGRLMLSQEIKHVLERGTDFALREDIRPL